MSEQKFKIIYILRLLTEYCRMKSFQKDEICMSYGGRLILDTDTPESLGLKEGDKVEVFHK